MSKYSLEQYKKMLDFMLEKCKADTFYTSQWAKFGTPTFPTVANNVIIFGIRVEGKEIKNRENIADDIISYVKVNNDLSYSIKEFVGTTESGLFTQVINPKGDFKMNAGIYFFKHGLHHGKNPCLIQADKVVGQRAKKGQPYSGRFEIADGSLHIHAGVLNLNNVGNWSSGCSVVAGGWTGRPWLDFYGTCKSSTQKTFTYVLINESDANAL